jgi:hypothetical protein
MASAISIHNIKKKLAKIYVLDLYDFDAIKNNGSAAVSPFNNSVVLYYVKIYIFWERRKERKQRLYTNDRQYNLEFVHGDPQSPKYIIKKYLTNTLYFGRFIALFF